VVPKGPGCSSMVLRWGVPPPRADAGLCLLNEFGKGRPACFGAKDDVGGEGRGDWDEVAFACHLEQRASGGLFASSLSHELETICPFSVMSVITR
jgi:hypothetical protein